MRGLLGERPTNDLALSGGGVARNELWCQVISNATGRPVTAPDIAEVGARGAVLSAAADLGGHGSLTELVTTAVRPVVPMSPSRTR